MQDNQLPEVDVHQLFGAGVHFGHMVSRWNPKMSSYIFCERGGVHLIDLRSTKLLLRRALRALYETSRQGGKILFVGTKPSAKDAVAHYARQCGQFYVNHRWLGGTITNWKTISKSVKKLEELEKAIAAPHLALKYTKKEMLGITRAKDKLHLVLEGIRSMKKVPDLLVVLDTVGERIAIDEAKRASIPTIGIVDTNSDPDRVDLPVPGNDDSSKSLDLYMNLFCEAVLSGTVPELAEKAGLDGQEAPLGRAS